MALVLTAENTISTVMSSDLDSLADGAVAVASTASSNDAAAERQLFGEFEVYIDTQGGARDGSAEIILAILPEVDDSNYPNSTYSRVIDNYVVKTWTLDAAATAWRGTCYDIKLPPGDFKVAIVNDTGQALAASANTVKMRTYTYEATV